MRFFETLVMLYAKGANKHALGFGVLCCVVGSVCSEGCEGGVVAGYEGMDTVGIGAWVVRRVSGFRGC